MAVCRAVLLLHMLLPLLLHMTLFPPSVEAQPSDTSVDLYFMERFPTSATVESLCGVCMDSDERQCHDTSTLLSDGEPPDAIFIGNDADTSKLEHDFGNAYECFTPEVFEVKTYPSATSAGAFASSTLPAVAATTGFYTSVWGAGPKDVVRVNATNKVRRPVRVLGVPPAELGNCTVPACPYGTIKIRDFKPAPAKAYTLEFTAKSLVEAFVASNVSTEGEWAAAVLFFHNVEQSTIDVTYLLYFTVAGDTAGTTQVYAFEASYEEAGGASSGSTQSQSQYQPRSAYTTQSAYRQQSAYTSQSAYGAQSQPSTQTQTPGGYKASGTPTPEAQSTAKAATKAPTPPPLAKGISRRLLQVPARGSDPPGGVDRAALASSRTACAIAMPSRPGCLPRSPTFPSCRYACSYR